MCFFCARPTQDPAITNREQALALLAQLERPGAIPRADALRLGAQLLAWSETGVSRFRCEAILPGAAKDQDLVVARPA